MVGWPRSTTVDALLRLTLALLAAAGGLLGYRVVSRPALGLDVPQTASVPDSEPIAGHPSKPLGWYAPIWQRDLRQPPIPPPVETEPQTPQAPRRPLPRLLGTFVESDARWAHFATRDGRTRVCKVNESIEDFRVAAIEPGRAQLTHGGSMHWVEVPRPKSYGPSE